MATLAITQPLLGILGDNPTFFTAHESTPGQIIWLTLIVALVPTAVLAAVEIGAHLVETRVGERVHIAIIAALAFLVVIQIVDVLPGPWVIPVLAAVAIAAGLVVLYLQQQTVRSVVSMLALTPLLFVGLFLFVSPASSVVFPDDVDAVDLGDLLSEEAFDDVADDADSADDVDPPTLAERIDERFPSIYFLILDELPMASLLDETGEIDAARWPNFARLGATSHLFSNATTVGFTTERAVPAMLTARYETAAAPVYSLYPENLFTLLGDIYDASLDDPLVDLCPPSVCDGAPPQAMVDLLATSVDAPTTSLTTTTTTTVPPEETGEAGRDTSLGLLLDDAMIVFGHLATPDGLDIGLPSIGATWGNFGGDQRIADGPESEVDDDSSPTTSSTSTTAPLSVDVGQVPVDEVTEVDADAINEQNTEFLDSLIIDDSRVADFRAGVSAITKSDTPRLHVSHTLLPHVPWRIHPSGDVYADIALPGYFSMWDDDEATARAGQQRHLLQLQFSDRLLGEYLDQLEREDIFDDATVIVVADHGISFVAGSRSRGPGAENIGGTAGVPLFYKLPGQTEPTRHHNPVETIDILPTIAAQLKIEVPWAIDGVDLFGPEIERDRAIWHPFSSDIPDPYQPLMDQVTEDLLATFGNGTTGSLYATAGLPELIGQPVTDLIDQPAGYCWLRERPTAVPEEDGETGYVYGRLSTSSSERIPLALTIADTLTGTSVSLDDGVRHRVFAFGDPQYWSGAALADIGLHEIVDGRLRPIAEC